MKIKSLLLGSAAALVAVTGARAADAVVIPEPELVEYVRVCDTYGTGFFYIPGTETCLSISGYVRYQIDIEERFTGGGYAADAAGPVPLAFEEGDATVEDAGISFFTNGEPDGIAASGDEQAAVYSDYGWEKTTSADLNIDVRSETELGTLRGFIGIEMSAASETVNVDQIFIELGGLHMGYSDNAFDAGIVGEVDSLGGAKVNRIAYTFTSGAFSATLSVDDDDAGDNGIQDFEPNFSGNIAYDAGMFDAALYGAYDSMTEEAAVKGIIGVDVSDAGRLELAAYYTSGATYVFDGTTTLALSGTGLAAVNAAAPLATAATAGYATGVPLWSEWSVQGGYQHQVTEKLALTGTAVYWDNIAHIEDMGVGYSADAWGVGLVVDYEIVENLDMKINVQHIDADVDVPGYHDIFDAQTSGFVRFERSF